MIKIFKKEKSFKKPNLFINPDIYWRSVLGVGFLLALAAMFLGLYLFMNENKELILPAYNTSVEATLKKERIDNVLQYFYEREQKSNQIFNSPSSVIDPSL